MTVRKYHVHTLAILVALTMFLAQPTSNGPVAAENIPVAPSTGVAGGAPTAAARPTPTPMPPGDAPPAELAAWWTPYAGGYLLVSGHAPSGWVSAEGLVPGGRLPGEVNHMVGPEDEWQLHQPRYATLTPEGISVATSEDPYFEWATFIGGTGTERVRDVMFDEDGGVVIVGYTSSTNLHTSPGALNATSTSGDVFVAKYDASGDLVYTTYFGGNNDDQCYAGALGSAAGAVCVAGSAASASTLPDTPGAFQAAGAGGYDGWIAIIVNGTTLDACTWLGGGSADAIEAVAVNATGHVFVAGRTDSIAFPAMVGSYDTSHSGSGTDAFAGVMLPDLSERVYMSFLGDGSNDIALGIDFDGNGSAYVAGYAGTGFPTTAGAYNRTFGGGTDAFLTKMTPDGSDLDYSTYVGNFGADQALGISVNATSGDATVVGSAGLGFPTTSGAFNETHGGGLDAFALKMDANGSALVFSTLLGGSDDDVARAVRVFANETYLIGGTESTQFPVSSDALNATHGKAGVDDAFVSKLSSDGSTLEYSTFLGGGNADTGYGIDTYYYAYGDNLTVALGGDTASSNFPLTLGANDTSYAGSTDGFVGVLWLGPGEVDLHDPEMALVSATGQVVHGEPAVIHVSVTDAHLGDLGVALVYAVVDGVNHSSTNDTLTDFWLSIDLGDDWGAYLITVIAVDGAGRTATVVVAVDLAEYGGQAREAPGPDPGPGRAVVPAEEPPVWEQVDWLPGLGGGHGSYLLVFAASCGVWALLTYAPLGLRPSAVSQGRKGNRAKWWSRVGWTVGLVLTVLVGLMWFLGEFSPIWRYPLDYFVYRVDYWLWGVGY